MIILITGCRGQLGEELLDILARGESQIGEIPQELKEAEVVAVDIDDLDITDSAAVSLLVSSQQPDVIINCAAMTDVNGCETKKELAFKVNAVGVRNLACAAENIGAKFIHVSTDYVFAGDAKTPYTEWDMIDPQSIYGKSKALGEKYALSFCRRTFIVRTAWLYGRIGKNFVKTMRSLGASSPEITVVSDQRGNPTNANDLAHHLLKLAASEEYGIYHCTGRGECSWYDFACKIMELSGIQCNVIPCTTEQYPTPAKRPAFSSLDDLALRCTVGSQMRHWEVALEEYIKNLED